MASTKPKSETIHDAMPSFEMPAAMRDMAEKGAETTKEAMSKFKAAAQDAGDAVEGAYGSVSKGASAFGLKAIEASRANANAMFDHAMALFSAKTLSEAIELNTSFARKQAEALTAQTKAMVELAQSMAGEAAAPLKAQMEKAFTNK